MTNEHQVGIQRALLHVRDRLQEIEQRMLGLETEMQTALDRIPSERRDSARNLVHYIALRQQDLRDLQVELADLGLSSLGRLEGCVLGTIRSVLDRTREALAWRKDTDAQTALQLDPALPTSCALDWSAGMEALHQHTRELLGPKPAERHVYIMVTAPSASEGDAPWMETMLRAGMNVLRINCAHEGPAEWGRLASAVRQASELTKLPCRILMDLAGPKIRTGAIQGAPRVATWKPEKDELGRVVSPARVLLRRESAPSGEGPEAELVLGDDGFATLKAGDSLEFRDTRGKRRALSVVSLDADTAVLEAMARAYVLEEVEATHRRHDDSLGRLRIQVPSGADAAVEMRVDDELVLSGTRAFCSPPKRSSSGELETRGEIACTLAAALDGLHVGHRVLFDDGKVEAVVIDARPTEREYLLKVTRTQRSSVRIRAEKGINLPDSDLPIKALQADDLAALPFVAQYADAVSLSFARTPEDVEALHLELDRLGRRDIGVILKIETRSGFQNLPRLLLQALQRPPLGVMIARGDLAVEVGFERLAEVQEEMLWLCEASHVPAIWATQVLDNLAKTGVPSRAEVTDAAASVAAECVMLNKGPHVVDAVRTLADILERMEKHRFKKRSLARALSVSSFEERPQGPSRSAPPSESLPSNIAVRIS
ncbi:MAG: pyruvate kinase [Polyangiaceae bacterium]|nr:hypothetical protein [Myxococcales bacterium]MCB9586211.1 pyruvate kinase [Polyangiaceae bacterium]MCB9606888.1 pyruvate kinase [Polyangiaceae bacterium]